MKTYAVKITWVEETDHKQAGCLGFDETVQVCAANEDEAIRNATDGHEDVEGYEPVGEIVSWELATMDTHGAWDHLDDYESLEDAMAAAKEYAAEPRSTVHFSDEGVAVFGISCDQYSGSYEHRLEVHADGNCVHLEDGVIVGAV